MADLYRLGLVTPGGGNASLRASEDSVWITPSRVFKGDLRPGDLIRVSLEGDLISGEGHPSVETGLHLAVYRRNGAVSAVLHSHPTAVIALAAAGLPILPATFWGAALSTTPRLPCFPPGSGELHRRAADALGDFPVVILGGHGLVVAAIDIDLARELTVEMERTCQVMLYLHTTGPGGSTAPWLPDDQIAEIQKNFREKYNMRRAD